MTTNASGQQGWDHFPHEADIGLHGWGETPETAFEQTALAMSAAIAEPGCIRPEQAVSLQCRAPDLELLLIDWLNALIYEMSTRQMLFASYAVALHDDSLTATATGEQVDVGRHRPAVEIKGATYTALSVTHADDGLWHARCVIDV